MKNVELSVCIPVYNAEKYILKTIKSVLNQSFENFELIIIDNKSTDDTVNKIKTISDPRIKLYLNNENLGMVKNWNRCLEIVKGEYINFVCADDILAENCFEEKINCIKKIKYAVMVVSNTDIIDSNDNKIYTRKFFRKNKIIDGEKIARKSFRTRNLFGEPSNVLFKRNEANKIGVFNESLSYTPDWEYWIRLTKMGQVIYLNKSLSKFRVLPTSGTTYLVSKTKIMREDDRIFIKSIKDIYGKKIGRADVFLHKLIGTARLYFKFVFLKIFLKRGEK